MDWMGWIGFVFCMGVSGMLVFAGVTMGLWAMAMNNRFDGDAFAALLMLFIGVMLGHWTWVNAPFEFLAK